MVFLMETHMSASHAIDVGFTHVALVVGHLDRSREFYETFAGLQLVHVRPNAGPISRIAWMADPQSGFTIVLVESTTFQDTPLGPFGHIGMACASREEVDRLADIARAQNILRSPPTDSPHPVGYWAYISDPDGNTLELSHGQQIRFAAMNPVPAP